MSTSAISADFLSQSFYKAHKQSAGIKDADSNNKINIICYYEILWIIINF